MVIPCVIKGYQPEEIWIFFNLSHCPAILSIPAIQLQVDGTGNGRSRDVCTYMWRHDALRGTTADVNTAPFTWRQNDGTENRAFCQSGKRKWFAGDSQYPEGRAGVLCRAAGGLCVQQTGQRRLPPVLHPVRQALLLYCVSFGIKWWSVSLRRPMVSNTVLQLSGFLSMFPIFCLTSLSVYQYHYQYSIHFIQGSILHITWHVRNWVFLQLSD